MTFQKFEVSMIFLNVFERSLFVLNAAFIKKM